MAEVTHPEKAHNPKLDGVRGIAILLVLLHHWGLPLPASNRFAGPVQTITESCWVGVDLFFVLSGFLITGILVDTLNSPRFLRNFYARRFLRIFPLYYGVIVVLLLLTPLLHLEWRGMLLPLVLYLQNTGMGPGFDHYGLGHGINLNPYWSLAVEEQFYLLWPFAVLLVRDVKRLTQLAVGLSILALLLRVGLVRGGVSPWLVYCFTACRADALLLGCALALLLRSKDAALRDAVVRWAPWVAVACALALVPVGYQLGALDWKHSSFLQTVGFSLIALSACGVVAWTQRESRGRFLTLPVLRFFGRYSYGIYMLHLLCFRPLYKGIEGLAIPFFHWWQVAAVLSWLAAAGIVIGAAVLSFRLYESPFLKLKRHFAYR